MQTGAVGGAGPRTVKVSAMEMVISYSATVTVGSLTPDHQADNAAASVTVNVPLGTLPYPEFASRDEETASPHFFCYFEGQSAGEKNTLTITSHTGGTCKSASFPGRTGRALTPFSLVLVSDVETSTEPVDYYYNQELPTHCYNKAQDGDETSVDKGGACGEGASGAPHSAAWSATLLCAAAAVAVLSAVAAL